MAAVVAAAGQVVMEKSVGKMSASTSTCVDSKAFGVVARSKVCVPVGLGGDGLGAGRRDRVSFSRSSPSSCSGLMRRQQVSSFSPAALAHVRGVQELETLLMDIDSRDLEVEAPMLLRQCSDLDWKKLVDDLRSEALHGLNSVGLRASSQRALEKMMSSWIHDEMVGGIESGVVEKDDMDSPGTWNFESAATELRMQAKLQAAQALAMGVDSSFDWETDVAELHQRIIQLQNAEPRVIKSEERLWQTWAHAQGQFAEASNQLAHEALECTAVNGQEESSVSDSGAERRTVSSPKGSIRGKSLLSIGAAVATGLAVEGSWMLDALAEETTPDAIKAVGDAVEAASRAPSWLVPVVLIFPPLSYFLFNIYRDKVNPYAKLTDWAFGIVAITIVSNIFMMAVWGVRLY